MRRSLSPLLVLSTTVALLFASTGRAQVVIEHEQRLYGSNTGVNAWLGLEVDLSGELAIAGAHDETVQNLGQAGAAYVYRLGKRWREEQHLVSDRPTGGEFFGSAVAVDGDWVAVGAPYSARSGVHQGGAVHVFQFDGNAWGQVQLLTAPDPSYEARFGSVLSLDGDTLAVTAPAGGVHQPLAGSVYLYRQVGGIWSLEQEIASSDGEAFDDFGGSLALDGDQLAVGTPGDSYAGLWGVGSCYLFERQGTTWSQHQKIDPPFPDDTARFGTAVALDANRLAVGAPDHSPDGKYEGAAHAYRKVGGVWSHEQRLVPHDPERNSRYGDSIALEGDQVLVGVPLDTDAGTNTGSATLFRHDGNEWKEQAKLLAGDRHCLDVFGQAVALDGGRAFVGAFGHDGRADGGGAAYVFAIGDLSLSPSHASLDPGDRVEFLTGGGFTGGITGLFVTAVNGTAWSTLLHRGAFDTAGVDRFTATVPSGLSGLELELTAFGMVAPGLLGASQPVDVELR